MKTLLDTGPLVAFLNRRDAYHDWTREALSTVPPPLWTCEPVLAEAAYLSKRPSDIMQMLADGALRIGLSVETEADALRRVLDRYGHRMDLADACVVRMSEIYSDSRVLTLDRTDFSFYRRNGRAVIPLLAPPPR